MSLIFRKFSFIFNVVLTAEPNWSTFYLGESITFRCYVNGGEETNWKYQVTRKSQDTFPYDSQKSYTLEDLKITEFQCSARWRGVCKKSETISLTVLVFNKVIVSRHPNWSQMFSGETITLTCEVQGGETTEWKCEWSRDGSVIHWTSKDWTFKALPSSSGDYICHCRRRDDWYSPTMWWSKAIKLSVARKPKVQLSANSLPGRVTLTCSVTPSPIGWKYYWYRDEKSAEPLTTQKPVFSPNELMSVSEKSLYWCRGGRGEPEYYTDYSNPITISNNVSNKVVATQQPNRPQMFSGETITLTCEVQGGETTEWTCEWRRPGLATHRANGKDWTLRLSDSSSGDYMCRCRRRDDWHSSTKWSEAITLSVSDLMETVSNKVVVTRRPNRPQIFSGGSVTLTCTVTSSSSGWKYFWYKERDSSEPLTGEEADFPSNGQMNVSEEGLYWCRGGRGEPAYYTDYS
uniref:Ig-like domain-containing protein n=1 Tax=Poecilia formosa TaxID=48698 RepID=A0A096MEX2_POEFO